MIQLVQPNLGAVGQIAYCLQYADRVAGLSGGEQTAWIGWNNTRLSHTDAIPGDVAVPCWFSYWLDGVNLGHVVWSVPGQGFYSSPYKSTGQTHAVLSSIAEVERIYGCKYVGWSEDISGLRVVTEDLPMATVLAGVPTSVSWGDGRIDVFAHGTDNGLWHLWYDNAAWSNWERLGDLAGSPSVSSWASGRLDVFGIGTAGDLVHYWYSAKEGWNGPESLGKP